MKNKTGFTLIEVLIALAIISIAFTAIIQATARSVRDTMYLQNKTIALWVGNEVMSQVRLKLLKVPEQPDNLEQDTTMLGQAWTWRASFKTTPNPNIKEIQIDVLQRTSQPLIHLVSYLYVAS